MPYKIKTNKILIILILVILFFLSSFLNVGATSLNNEELLPCNATLDDDFLEDNIMVVLKNDISLQFKSYTIDDFSEINCVKVEDLTENSIKLIQQQDVAEETGDWSSLDKHIENNMLIEKDSFHRILCLTIGNPGKINVLSSIKELEKRNDVVSVEPNYVEKIDYSVKSEISRELSSIAKIYDSSSDVYLSNQWGLKDGYGINIDKAWKYTTGKADVLVGVIDSGIDGEHPDLINIINDDLHRDYVDTPLLSDSREVEKEDLEDLLGHGTHVAGIIGAQGNNGIGISGVAWNIRLISLRVFNEENIGDSADVKRAIDFATKKAIPILNYSGYGKQDHNGRKKAIENYPGLFVCISGNDNQDNDVNDNYPGNYSFNNLITVGAIKKNGERPTSGDWGIDDDGNEKGSNYGANNVDIFAPGDGILSTFPSNKWGSEVGGYNQIAEGYAITSGTSMAAPFVTGVAALMLSANPTLTPQQLKFTIMNNVTKYSALEDLCISEGRLDAFKSVSAAVYLASSVDEGILINGIFNKNDKTKYKSIEIPTSFSPISTIYGTAQQEVCIIGSSVFEGCTNLTSITIPNTVTSIGDSAFAGCTNLVTINFSNNLTTIGENAFAGCEELMSVAIPDSVTSIGDCAFKGCSSLENVTIPKNVSTIGNNAFENCSGLETVEFKKNLYDINRIPNIGTSVFAGCNNLEIINVNHKLILDYKNDPNWSAYKEKIQTSYAPTFPTHDINCRTNKTINKYLFEGYNEIYQLEVDCVKVYEITVSSTYPIEFSIYDSNMNLINTPLELSSDECTGVMDAYFNKGTYYIKINYQSYSSSGDFVLTIKPKWETYQIQVIEGTNNILNHLHLEDGNRTTNVYFNNEKGIGFYEFKICAIKTDGTEVIYDASTILIKDEVNRYSIKKYDSSNCNIIAENVENSNNICLFMDRTGYFYIDITLNNEEYNSVTLTISESSSKDIEVLARYNQSFTEQIISSNTIGDAALKFTINQQSLFEVIINPSNTYNEDVKIVIFRAIYDTTAQEYSYEEKLVSSLPLDKTKINLEVGNYYIGLFNKTTKETITIKFNRLLELEGIADQVLVCDIDENLPYGTEVRHNGGMLNQNTITIGFTRHLHFKNVTGVPSTSRYDYNFRSNKPSIASVSEYGTVYAEKVGSAIITATYKENSAVVFYIEITVVSNESMEELIIESSLTYSLSSTTDIKDGKYNLELTEYNSPYPWIQYYTWTISSDDDITVTMDYFGRIVASGPGTIILEGIYNVNNKVELRITITVTE